MTSAEWPEGLVPSLDSAVLCDRRGGACLSGRQVAGSGPGDLSPTMRIREACRRDRRSAAADRPLLLDVLGKGPRPGRLGRIVPALIGWITEPACPAGRSDRRHA